MARNPRKSTDLNNSDLSLLKLTALEEMYKTACEKILSNFFTSFFTSCSYAVTGTTVTTHRTKWFPSGEVEIRHVEYFLTDIANPLKAMRLYVAFSDAAVPDVVVRGYGEFAKFPIHSIGADGTCAGDVVNYILNQITLCHGKLENVVTTPHPGGTYAIERVLATRSELTAYTSGRDCNGIKHTITTEIPATTFPVEVQYRNIERVIARENLKHSDLGKTIKEKFDKVTFTEKKIWVNLFKSSFAIADDADAAEKIKTLEDLKRLFTT